MIKKITCLFIIIFNCLVIQAQIAHGFKYQTVVRGATGAIESNKIVSIRFSVLVGSENGAPVYSEKHSKATNEFGILNVNIGEGEVLTGLDLSTINWADDKHFLKVDLDINGGNNFQFMGTSELFSVPYAMFAQKAATALDDDDKNPTNELQNITLTDNNLNLSQNGGSVNLSPYLDNTDNQTIELTGNTLSISNGNSIVLSGAVDLDPDPTNEIQNLTLNGNALSISQGNSVDLPPNLDNDPTNEIQNLSIIGNTISISQGNNINIPANLDNNPANELQNLILNNDTLSISQGNSIDLSGFYSPAYPHGYIGELVFLNPAFGQEVIYTVPNGKVLYVTTSSILLLVDEIIYSVVQNATYPYSSFSYPPVFGENTSLVVRNTDNNTPFCGFLFDKKNDLEVVNFVLTSENNFVVPEGKMLYLRSGLMDSSWNGPNKFKINNQHYQVYNYPTEHVLFLPSGTILSVEGSLIFGFTGILK